jgi:hypothetical protein
MQQKTVAIFLYSAFKKSIIWLAASVHNYWFVRLLASSKQQQRVPLGKILGHIKKEIKGQPINVN